MYYIEDEIIAMEEVVDSHYNLDEEYFHEEARLAVQHEEFAPLYRAAKYFLLANICSLAAIGAYLVTS